MINVGFALITMSQRKAGHKAGVYGHATGTKLSGCDTSTENPRMREQEWDVRMRHEQGENCVGARSGVEVDIRGVRYERAGAVNGLAT